VKKQTVIALVVLAGIGGYLWWRLHPNEERVVAKRVASFAECVSKTAGEGNAMMAIKANNLPGFLASRVGISVSSQQIDGTYDGTELASLVSRARTMFSSLDLVFHDITVSIDSPDTASATFTARLTAAYKQGGSQTETREVHAQLKKSDGVWQFVRFAEEEVMVK
jgi:hypothetical protein